MGRKKVKKEEEVKKEPVGSIVSELPEKTIAIKITKKGFRYDVAVSKDSEAILGGFKISSLKIVKTLVFEVLENLLKECGNERVEGEAKSINEDEIYSKKKMEQLVKDAKANTRQYFAKDACGSEKGVISGFTEEDYAALADRFLKEQLEGDGYYDSWYSVISDYVEEKE